MSNSSNFQLLIKRYCNKSKQRMVSSGITNILDIFVNLFFHQNLLKGKFLLHYLALRSFITGPSSLSVVLGFLMMVRYEKLWLKKLLGDWNNCIYETSLEQKWNINMIVTIVHSWIRNTFLCLGKKSITFCDWPKRFRFLELEMVVLFRFNFFMKKVEENQTYNGS